MFGAAFVVGVACTLSAQIVRRAHEERQPSLAPATAGAVAPEKRTDGAPGVAAQATRRDEVVVRTSAEDLGAIAAASVGNSEAGDPVFPVSGAGKEDRSGRSFTSRAQRHAARSASLSSKWVDPFATDVPPEADAPGTGGEMEVATAELGEPRKTHKSRKSHKPRRSQEIGAPGGSQLRTKHWVDPFAE